MLKKYVLSDGIELEVSDRKSNRSGYTGAALSPSWTLNADKPFIAACGNPRDPKVMAEVNAQHRTSLHLGCYGDAREAAYVVGMYRKDPVHTIRYIQSHGAVDKFPADLYDLPPGLAYEEAVTILNERKLKSKKTKSTKVTKIDLSTVPAQGNIFNYFKRDQVVPIAQQLGGPEAFQAEIKNMSVAQFAKKYNLVIA